jgi:hypothetical protein
MFWATVAAFLGVCAYTGVATVQVYKSETANEIADRSSYITNRPYLMFDHFNPAAVVESGKPIQEWRIGPVFTNYGNTTADKVTFYVCNPIVSQTVNQPNFECKFSEKQVRAMPVGPKQPTGVFGVPVSVDDFSSTETGKKFLYIFGYATYYDQLKPDKLHQTRFCMRVIKSSLPSSPALPAGITGSTMVGCNDPEWVCFDDGCPSNWPGQ